MKPGDLLLINIPTTGFKPYCSATTGCGFVEPGDIVVYVGLNTSYSNEIVVIFRDQLIAISRGNVVILNAV